ncbi:MAG: M20 family metallopeptidase [Lachnospiraceae bacterium]
MKQIDREIEKIYDEAVRFRRKLHEYPELGMEEVKTTAAIVEVLEKYEIRYKSFSPSGVVAYMGKPPYKKALRADMDALKVLEQTKVSYCSKREGFMHACGHDFHTTSLLYSAILLKQMEEKLKEGVLFVFQPSEENCKGANFMMETGVLDNVEEIFGIHIFTDIESGKISLESGERMARTDKFKIKVEGVGGHAGKPHQCIDATVAAASLVLNLQSIVSRELDPIETAVVTVGQLHSGTAYNIISKEAYLEGTVRSFSDEVAEKILVAIERISEDTAITFRAKAKVEFEKAAHPPLINDKALIEKIMIVARKYFKEDEWIHVNKMMLGEDFSNYQKKMRGCFAFVGAGGEKSYPNHHPEFNPTENVLKQCIKLYISAAIA